MEAVRGWDIFWNCPISVLVSQTSFSRETTSGGVTKCKLFSLAILPGFSSKTGAICHWRDLVSILCTTLLAGVKDNHH